MNIKLTTNTNDDKVLIIEGTGPASEDTLLEKWHEQIINHMKKLNLK